MTYEELLQSKVKRHIDSGFEADDSKWTHLYPFQKYAVKKALKAGKFAMFENCGLGKTRQQITWANEVANFTKHPVLILAPLGVVGQTIEEADNIGIPIQKLNNKPTTGIYITNYDQIDNIDCSLFSGIALDECFAPDTKIKVLDANNVLQEKYIKDCLVGDKVLNCTGFDTITEVKKKKIDYAITIGFNGKYVTSSGRHPYFTQRGWVAAKNIQKDDSIISTDKSMRILRGEFSSNIQGRLKEKVLRDILLSEMENETARIFNESTQSNSSSEKREVEKRMVQNARSSKRTSTNKRIEPNATSEIKGQGICNIENDETQTFSAWGEWSRDDIASAINEGCIVRKLDSGICHISGKATKGLSDKLQSGFSGLREKNCDRSGWEFTLQQKRDRQEEGRKTGEFRVESFEVLEQTDTRLDKYRDAEGALYFYDLSIAKHPSFTISECLVHNSSIIKNFTGATRNKIVENFYNTPFKLCCTATPSPNDELELGNHSEFLGNMTSQDMRAMFFTTDKEIIKGNKYKLKSHAVKDFYKWISTWAIMVEMPSDIGYSDEGYNLPPLNINEILIATPKKDNGYLFNDVAVSATTHNKELRNTMVARLTKVAELVNNSTENWIIWVKQNEEGEQLKNLIPDAIEVKGSDSVEFKTKHLLGFAKNEFRVLITKTKVASFGLNYQNCHNQVFASLDFSFEGLYQAIRRSYRFGQTKPVNVHLISTDTMQNVVTSIKEKELKFKTMQHEMKEAVMSNYQIEHKHTSNGDVYKGENFTLINGDCVTEVAKLEANSIDYCFFSPPFGAMYVFSDDPRDLSNVKDDDEFYNHFRFLVKELKRVMKAGRLVSLHIMQSTTLKGRDGYYSIKDFRGEVIRLFQSEGFYFHAEVMIRKDPKTAAIRTKNRQLMHGTTKEDSTISRSGLADFIVTFRNSGENEVPVQNNIPFDLWCKIAEPVWIDIEEGDTVRYRDAKGDKDERHITPTQLTPIKYCYMMWCNEGETVLSPFSGVASEGTVALLNNRKYIGVELKKSYFDASVKNLIEAEKSKLQTSLFKF